VPNGVGSACLGESNRVVFVGMKFALMRLPSTGLNAHTRSFV